MEYDIIDDSDVQDFMLDFANEFKNGESVPFDRRKSCHRLEQLNCMKSPYSFEVDAVI
jgi:hypothetical protein